MYVVSTDRAVSPQEIFAFLHVTAGGVRARRALRLAQAPTSGTIDKISFWGCTERRETEWIAGFPSFYVAFCITSQLSHRAVKKYLNLFIHSFSILPAKRENSPIKNKRKHTISRTFSLIDCPAISCGCILYVIKILSSQTASAQYLLT